MPQSAWWLLGPMDFRRSSKATESANLLNLVPVMMTDNSSPAKIACGKYACSTDVVCWVCMVLQSAILTLTERTDKRWGVE